MKSNVETHFAQDSRSFIRQIWSIGSPFLFKQSHPLKQIPYVTQVMIKFKNTMINHLLTLFLIFNKASEEI